MATNSAHPPTPPAPDAHFDDKTGIYGFFRRHQKKLLYTVGLFTLLTFSVGGPMLAVVRSIFNPTPPMPSILVGAQRVELTAEDMQVARALARSANGLYPVLPQLGGNDSDSEMTDVFAMLRRAAIAQGIDASFAEVDQAITSLGQNNKLSPAQLAGQRQLGSVAEFRNLMREAMRIGELVRLQSLMLDESDAAVLKQVITDREKIGFLVATYDEKAHEEQLKKAGGLSDDDLHKWLDGKNENEKFRLQVFDTNHVQLTIGAAMQADFDRTQWLEDALKDFKIGDAQLKKTYEAEKEARFKLEDKKWKPAEDEAVKAELTKLIELDQVMNFLRGKLSEQVNESLKPLQEALGKAKAEADNKARALSEANAKEAEAKAKLAEKPEDEALKAALADASAAASRALGDVTQQDALRKAAEEAVTKARAEFDFASAFAALTKDKKGFVVKATVGLKNGEELKDLDANDLGLGQWALAVQGTYLQNKGDLANQPGRSTKATFLYQVKDIVVRPLKPWDKLKPLLEGAYYTEKAKADGEAQKKIMEDSLLELAKGKMPDKVKEIESKRAETVATKFAEWTKRTEAELAAAEKQVADLVPETQAGMAWIKKRDALKDQLAKQEEKKKSIEEDVGKQIEADIGAEAKKHHHEVLGGAAANAGFATTEVGPYPRDLQSKPRFDKAYDPSVVFLFRNHSKMKEGESTGVVRDEADRRWIVGCCTKVLPLDNNDVERRDFELFRKGFGYFGSYASMQAGTALRQAWTKEALEQRYAYERPAGEAGINNPKKPDDPKKDEKKQDEKGNK